MRVLAPLMLAIFGFEGVAFSAIQLPQVSVTGGEFYDSVEGGLGESQGPSVFVEATSEIVDSAGISVDHDGSPIVARPTSTGGETTSALTPAVIPAGSAFDSYLFHYDPLGDEGSSTYVVTIELNAPIIGVQLFDSTAAQQTPLGESNPSFSSVPTNGLEEDDFLFAIDGNRVMLAGSVTGADVDQVRILTLASNVFANPEPSSFIVWALLGLVGMSRRGQRRLA